MSAARLFAVVLVQFSAAHHKPQSRARTRALEGKRKDMSCRRPAVAGLGVVLVLAPFALGLAARAAHGPVAQAAPPPATDLYSGLRWRTIGPFRGGRVNAVGGV